MSPTQRTLAYLRERGYLCEVVERWIPGANIRKDLFGFIDIVGVQGADIVGVQSTSASNVSARIKKILEHENYNAVSDCMRIEVHGWTKGKKEPRVEVL